MMPLPTPMLHNAAVADKTECLSVNGSGSFACLAIDGGLSRKFHGLLVHSSIPPMDRILTWHSCIETLNGVSLDARQYRINGVPVKARGGDHLLSFQAVPVPTWLYSVNGFQLQKELFMQPGAETTLIRYTLLSGPSTHVQLQLDNFVHFRAADQHCPELSPETLAQWQLHAAQEQISHGKLALKLRAEKSVTSTQSTLSSHWFAPDEAPQQTHLVLPIECEDQGFDHEDSSLNINRMQVQLAQGESIFVIGTLEDSCPDADQIYQSVCQRAILQNNAFADDLAHSALQLVAERASVNGKTLLAGFPWFGDWGRDTMIALPGTTLATGQFDLARSILSTFAHYLSEGMLPNKFPDRQGEVLKYNTIDATLWFFWALQQYVETTGDWAYVQHSLYDALLGIIRHHQQGTRYGIRMDQDGLIQGGDASTQLTWMDVKFDDTAVTPRFGKAVEINALWFNALNFTEQCARQFNDDSTQLSDLIARVRTSFQDVFWNADQQCCYDFVTAGGANDDIRCNQIFAVSLPFSPLTVEQQRSTYQTVFEQLYTPVGLRSLSPQHPDYKPRYYGPLRQRDLAYHQGTVWAWPMGAFIDATMKLQNDPQLAADLLRGLKQHFYTEGGIHGVAEVFDAEPPHHARGCFHQAWSVAELLRVVDRYQLNV